MAGSLNKVMIIGNLGKDPEIRTLNSGDRVANMTIATSEQWRDKVSGERKEKTEWHRVVIFNDKIAAIAEEYLRKGSTVYIEGSLQTRKWTDNQGVDKYQTEIVIKAFDGKLTLLGGRKDSRDNAPGADSPDDYGVTKTRDVDAKGRSISTDPENRQFDLDDEIPF